MSSRYTNTHETLNDLLLFTFAKFIFIEILCDWICVVFVLHLCFCFLFCMFWCCFFRWIFCFLFASVIITHSSLSTTAYLRYDTSIQVSYMGKIRESSTLYKPKILNFSNIQAKSLPKSLKNWTYIEISNYSCSKILLIILGQES